ARYRQCTKCVRQARPGHGRGAGRRAVDRRGEARGRPGDCCCRPRRRTSGGGHQDGRHGFGLAFFGLVLGGFAIQNAWKILIVVGACILMWGHYWDASNGMTIASMVAPTRFRATAAGFGYVFVKAAAFFGAFVFPLLSEALGKAGATFAVASLSLIGFLAAKFILPEL